MKDQDDIQVSGLADQGQREDEKDGEGEVQDNVLGMLYLGALGYPSEKGDLEIISVEVMGKEVTGSEVVWEKFRIRRVEYQCQHLVYSWIQGNSRS